MATTHRRGVHTRSLRIIAGAWRGRRWRFPDTTLRPTPDRVRETLFNWLQDRIVGARCLDLFTGSGALGLEALSRGAREVLFVDSDPAAVRALRSLLADWAPEPHRAQIVQSDARAVLEGPARPMDLVFLDPPFDAGLLAPAAASLGSRGWLNAGASIYVEHALGNPWTAPADWALHRAGVAGAVSYHLYQFRTAKEQAR